MDIFLIFDSLMHINQQICYRTGKQFERGKENASEASWDGTQELAPWNFSKSRTVDC